MKRITRRSFLKTGATAVVASAAIPYMPAGWYSLNHPGKPGYFESEFGITDSLCRKVLTRALSKGGDFADLYFEHTISNWVILQDGKVNRAYSDVSLGVGIRTVKGDQVGYGFTQELTPDSMLAAASTAATIADSEGKEVDGQFVQPVLNNYYQMEKLLTSVPLESKLPLVQSVNDKCFALSSLIVKVNAGFHDQQKRILIVTSEGKKIEDLLPKNYLYTTVVAQKGDKLERAWWNLGGRHGFSYYTPEVIDEVAKTAVERAVVLFDEPGIRKCHRAFG